MPDSIIPVPESRHYHDLDALAREIRSEYFPDFSSPAIQWGKKITRKRRRSIRLGSYHPSTAVIRIHPLLDSPHVPRFFVQAIIHHEYLHHVLGGAHNRRFHTWERRFRYHRESKEWLRRHLPVLLGRRIAPLPSAVPRSAAPPATAAPQQMALF